MEPTFPLTVTEAGRADALIAAGLDGVTRSAAQRWLEEGRVTRNGAPVRKNDRLSPGDLLLISPPQPEEADLIPQDIPLDVFEAAYKYKGEHGKKAEIVAYIQGLNISASMKKRLLEALKGN